MAEVYDFIVVGSGASGAVVASRLSEDPDVTVLLLEAGGTPPPESVIPAAAGALQTEATAFQFRDTGSPGAALGFVDQQIRLPCGKLLGGSTSINFMAYVRGHPGDFDAWAAAGATGWGWDDVLPFFKKSEGLDLAPDDDSRKINRSEHGTDGPWGISCRDGGAVPYAATFVEQCRERGYDVGDYNSTDRVNSSKGVVGAHQYSIKKGQRASTYTCFLQPVESRPNLKIITNATANKVVIEEGVAKGVEFVTSSGTVFAKASKEVVLSCGAYQSPQVLLRSGVGPKSELEAMKIDCVVDSPHVGKHLKDHMFLFIPFACENSTALGDLMASLGMTEDKTKLNDYLATGKGIPATGLYEASVFYNTGLNPAKKHTHDAQISAMATCLDPNFFKNGMGIKDFDENYDTATMFDLQNAGAVIIATLIQPDSEGQVLLKSSDVHAAPVIEHNYLKEKIDVDTFVAICKEAAAIKNMIGTKTKVGDILIPKNVASKHGTDPSNDKMWEDWIRHYATTIYHPSSTCRIGDVVDPTCKVKGVDGLRVADASVMPDVTSGNTQAPCVMIGEKVADMIASKHGVKLH